ncbi:hypothetical protein [Novosphingobium lentum]|uniref:hypothetical protein n=1 Tax=Novosphingobium lentum TaxID=145287 RepID=UPI0012ECC199|nr:hypothetical protein [Novosphingobium lentum]
MKFHVSHHCFNTMGDGLARHLGQIPIAGGIVDSDSEINLMAVEQAVKGGLARTSETVQSAGKR